MDRTRVILFASVVAAAMVFGGVLGATVLARSTLTPASAALAYKSTQLYQAAASGALNKSVTWKVEPATGGGMVDGNVL